MAPEIRKTGSIARLFRDRVYGFLYCPADARDYFFHQSDLVDCTFPTLQSGDVMTFTVTEGAKGLQAEQVCFERHGEVVVPAHHEQGAKPSGRKAKS